MCIPSASASSEILSSGKDRLYVCLYARAGGGRPRMPGREDRYHWGLLIGPKSETSRRAQGTKCHIKDNITTNGDIVKTYHTYEECQVPLGAVDMIVVRIMIAKIVDREWALEVIRESPIMRAGDPGYMSSGSGGGKKSRDYEWNCVSWVKSVLVRLAKDEDALGTKVLSWRKVRDCAMHYAECKKEEHRFDGLATGEQRFDLSKVPTWDLINERELIP